ncbi:MAG: amidase [Terriglobia bacterium]
MKLLDNRISRRGFLAGGAALAGATALNAGRASAEPAAPDLPFATALEVARAIRGRKVSSVEITRLMLSRIERLNPKINAVVTVTAEDALKRARAADEAWARGEWWGPFHGVPCTIKDTFEVAGVRTTSGSVSLTDYVPKRDADVVARYRAAGAVILGKTNVPEFAGDWQSNNDVFGTTNNPWDLTRTPGGSSGGEAAALAAGLTYLCVGSDIGGSIRVPAHFCGVYGHKPTLNVVSREGHIPPLPGSPPQGPTDLPVAGPMARSAADLQAALEVLGGPTAEDSIAYRWSLPPARGTRLADYRIGFVLDDPHCRLSSDVAKVHAQAIERLRKAGARLEEGWPDGVDPAAQFETYRYLLDSFFAFRMRDDQEEELRKRAMNQDGSQEAFEARVLTAPHKYFQAAVRQRMAARAVWQGYFRTHDAFLLPTAFVPAFPHDHSQPQAKRTLATPEGPRPYMDLLFWMTFATLTGLPATVAPVGLTTAGLPVGIQILGPYLEDATPIDLAGKLADVTGGFLPPKGYELSS